MNEVNPRCSLKRHHDADTANTRNALISMRIGETFYTNQRPFFIKAKASLMDSIGKL